MRSKRNIALVSIFEIGNKRNEHAVMPLENGAAAVKFGVCVFERDANKGVFQRMKVKIEVGEPRGFNSGDGTNVIIGTVDQSLNGQQEVEVAARAATVVKMPNAADAVEKLVEYWFVVNFPPVKFGDITFQSLLFTPRYKAKKPPTETLLEPDQWVVVNGIWLKDNEPWSENAIAAAKDGQLDIDGMLVAKVTLFKE